MKYLIYTSLVEAKNRERKAFAAGVKAGLFPIGTEGYAIIFKHPHKSLFAIPLDEKYLSLFTTEELADAIELAPDWFNRGEIAGNFIIEEHISPDPDNSAVTRKACCNIPEVLTDTAKTFVLRVVIKHDQDGVSVPEVIPDREVFLYGRGLEFDWFYSQVAAGANILEMIRIQIQIEDSYGRFHS